jgi:hypothetical protein
VTIAERSRRCANALREKNLVPSTRLLEVTITIAASLEATEWKGIRELETRLKLAEDVCFALREATAASVVHINVARALKAWEEGQ